MPINKQNPLVSIVIPTYNRSFMVLRLLRSIVKNTYKDLEIIVIDDMSSDQTYKGILTEFPSLKNLKVIRNKRKLYTAGSRNLGIKSSKGKYIFFIDDDNVIEKDSINSLVSVFEGNEQTGELGLVNYSYADKKKLLWVCTKRNMATSRTYQPRSFNRI